MNNHVNNRIPEKSLLSNTTNFISFEYILFLWFHSRNKKSSFEPFEHPSITILNIAMWILRLNFIENIVYIYYNIIRWHVKF